jgi:hypothetical protein
MRAISPPRAELEVSGKQLMTRPLGNHTGDAVSLANTKNTSIHMRGASLESAVRIRNGASGIVVEMSFNVTANDSAKSSDKVVDLPGAGATNGISNTNAVHTNLVHSAVYGEQIDEIGPERICMLSASNSSAPNFYRRFGYVPSDEKRISLPLLLTNWITSMAVFLMYVMSFPLDCQFSRI